MREYVTTVTSKGRLTLPAAVRHQLRIEPGDQVSIVIEDEGGATLRRVEPDVRSVRGSIATPPGLQNEDFDELIEEAMTDHAEAMMHRLRGESR